jgi:autotransporter-associated beta strand protein
MDPTTVSEASFANAGTADATIGTVVQTLPGVFAVPVTPTSTGTLQLQIPSGAVLKDSAENLLDTTAALTDDTIINVNPAMAQVPFVIELTQAAAEAAILAAELAVGTVTAQPSDTVPAGQVLSQNPAGGTSVAVGSVVDLVISLGDLSKPSPDPMTFAVAPQAASGTTITMTATTATDANGVEYLFTNLTLGTHSGWQDSPVHESTGLTPGTIYTFTVTARDKSANQNTTAPSTPAEATIPAATDGTWNVNAGGDWSNAANWLDGIVANGAGATATITMTTSGNRTITVDSARTIGNLTRNWPQNSILTIGGSSTLTLAGQNPTLINNNPATNRRIEITAPLAGADGLGIAGGGMVWLKSASTTYTGPTTINGFLNFEAIANPNLGGGPPAGRNITVAPGSTVRFNALSNALLNRLVETTAEIVIMSGSTGNALDFSSSTGANLPNAFLGNWASNGAKMDYTGPITPAADNYRFGSATSDGLLTIASALSGPQGVLIGGNRVQLSAANTHTGTTVVRDGARLVLANPDAMQHSPLDTGNPANTGLLTLSDGTGGAGAAGTGAKATPHPMLGGLTGSRNLPAVINQGNATATASGTAGNNTGTLALNSITGVTLNVGPGQSFTYSGAIGDLTGSTTAFSVTKTGAGTQVLSGANTYTGPTQVSQGTLALVSGSLKSPITVAAGASLGLAVGSPTTSTSAVDLTTGTVTVTGTVDAASDYLLLTAEGGITGTPVVDPPVPGYVLEVQTGGTRLVLTPIGSPYETWAGSEPFAADKNGDGVANGLAFLLGAATPDVNARGTLPAGAAAGTALVLTFSVLNADHRGTATLSVQWCTDLGVTAPWAANEAMVPETTGTVNGVDFQITPNGSLNTVVATIPATPAAAGKMFVRLRALIPP